MSKLLIRRLIAATLGVAIIAIGVPFFVKANIGADCVTILYKALSEKSGLSLGRWNAICGTIYLVIILLIDKKKIGYTTIIYVISAQFIIDLFMLIIPEQHTLLSGVLLLIIGMCTCSIGCVICIAADVGLTIYDALVFALTDFLKIKYVYVRYIVDGTHLLLGIILGGVFGVGTILCLLIYGIILNTLMKIFKEPIKRVIYGNDYQSSKQE